MRKLYRKILSKLCKIEMKNIADNYPDISRDNLVRYHDFMAINCVDSDKKSAQRVLGISLKTAIMLENEVK